MPLFSSGRPVADNDDEDLGNIKLLFLEFLVSKTYK